MRTAVLCLLLATIGPVEAYASAPLDRQQLVEALERMIATGEPHHSLHDEGELVQRALDALLHGGDPALEQLAVRAASQISARAILPVATVREWPVHVAARVALTLPQSVSFTAEIFASVDGAELVSIGRVQPGRFAELRPPAFARTPGAHHVRLRALIVYEGDPGGSTPEPEYRDLPEVAYALYDPDVPAQPDARVFRFSPASVSAAQYDRQLPDVPLWHWLNAVLVRHGSDPLHELQWSNFFCDERTNEPEMPYRRLDVCAVVTFQVGSTVGQIWIRTGRINLDDPLAVQWFTSPPAFEAFRLISPESTEVMDLSALDATLAADPGRWPKPDVSIHEEEIMMTPSARAGATAVVTATVRNRGDADAHGVMVDISSIGGDVNAPAAQRRFVVDVPRKGAVTLEVPVESAPPYGFVLVMLLPALSDFAPFATSMNDPPANNMAYRFINPARAPKTFLDMVRTTICTNGGPCPRR